MEREKTEISPFEDTPVLSRIHHHTLLFVLSVLLENDLSFEFPFVSIFFSEV